MRFLRAPRPLLFSLGLVALASPAMAADTTTFNVRIIITKACTITAAAATDVDFGTALSTATTPSNAQGSVTAQCSALTPYTIALNAGSNAATANDVTTRRMRNTDAAVTTNNFVGYQLSFVNKIFGFQTQRSFVGDFFPEQVTCGEVN